MTRCSALRAVGVLLAAAMVCAACTGQVDPGPPEDGRQPTLERRSTDTRTGRDRQPAIVRLAVIENVELPSSVVTEESARARLLDALADHPERADVAAVDLARRVLVVLAYDACDLADPYLSRRGPDRLVPVFEVLGRNCFVPIPAIAVFSLARDQLPERVTLTEVPPPGGDLVIELRGA